MDLSEAFSSPRLATARSEGSLQLSVVIPVYNEENILMQMAEQLAPHLDEIAGQRCWQFVLVDNGSRDLSPQDLRPDRQPMAGIDKDRACETRLRRGPFSGSHECKRVMGIRHKCRLLGRSVYALVLPHPGCLRHGHGIKTCRRRP